MLVPARGERSVPSGLDRGRAQVVRPDRLIAARAVGVRGGGGGGGSGFDAFF